MPKEVATCECVCLTGATASGKTELATELADRFGAEIVSMDSAMVYRGMNIGTAKPGRALLRRIPHHLIDIRGPEDAYSAGQFAADARRAIAEIRGRGKLPLLVGGTLLYLRALREGLANLPERDDEIRAAIDREACKLGWPRMHERLGGVDPAAASRIEPTDKQRIQRALEVFELTGRPITQIQAEPSQARNPGILTVALVPEDRRALAERIERRFDAMVDAGLVAEVRGLMKRPGLSAASPAMRSVGYRQLWAHLAGESPWPEARERAIAATRQLAKRQMTWLRSDARCIKLPSESEELSARIGDQIVARFRFESGS